MDWKLEWTWDRDGVVGGDVAYFETQEETMNFVIKVTENPYKKVTSMYLTHVKKLI